ncbi:MAG TPA: lysylphosphatidylglycerol synthase domain-containing protein, partial [Chloroflexia bacterium]|nr:lysylphosphatidylglycerol synthase domain-containing protein [Chloroflexia bacterium]
QLGIDGRRAAVSVIADRTTSLLALVALGIVGLVLSPPLAADNADLRPWLVGIAVVLALVTVALVTGSGLGALGRLPLREGGILHRLSLQMQTLAGNSQGWRTLLVSMLLAILFQLGVVATNYVLCLALGIPLGFIDLLWVVAAASLLQSLPISIAGVGVREGAYVYILGSQGVDSASALALSLLVFGIQVLFALAGGLLQLQQPRPSKTNGTVLGQR